MAGAALRFSTLGLQSYRYDEAVTVGRVLQPSLFNTISTVPGSESTPPLYYLLAWLWSRPFGTGEVGLRSLSALAGTASILAVYLGAVALPLPRRAGLIAAAMVAVSPVLIWFSQDARAYALVFLLTALSFLFFARARLRGGRRDLTWWALFSALAIATHYFAAFVVAPEAVWLLFGRRATVVAPAWRSPPWRWSGRCFCRSRFRQAGNAHAGWIAKQPLPQRLERASAKLLGEDNGDEHGVRQPGPIPLAIPAAIAIAGLALLLWRGEPRERRGAGIAAAIGLAAVALPILLGAFGADYFDGRNLIPVFVPLIVVLAAGFAVRRAGLGRARPGRRLLSLLAHLHNRDRPPAPAPARGPSKRGEGGRDAAPRPGGGDDQVLRQRTAALLPRRPLPAQRAASVARNRPGRLQAGRRPQRRAPAAGGLSPGSSQSRSPTTSPSPACALSAPSGCRCGCWNKAPSWAEADTPRCWSKARASGSRPCRSCGSAPSPAWASACRAAGH